MHRCLRTGILCGTLVLGLGTVGAGAATDDAVAPGRALARQAVKSDARWITTDHSKHAILQQPFAKPEDVTKACLSCHNQAAL